MAPTSEGERRLQLPLFPLHVVPFPQVMLPLHIFEERYKRMIAERLQGDRRFGVNLILSGHEVGDPAIPHAVGTTVRIIRVEELAGGRMNLVTVGEERFRILEITQLRPYLLGWVELLPEGQERCGGWEPLVAQVKGLYEGYVRLLQELANRELEAMQLPEEPARLSYSIAHRLLIPTGEKQGLLELPSSQDRLREEVSLLQRECQRLRLAAITHRAMAGKVGEGIARSNFFCLN